MLSKNDSSRNEVAYQERLRQARLSFNFTLAAIATSVFISLVSVAFLLTGGTNRISAMKLAIASNIVIVRCLQLARDANDRFDKTTKDSLDES
ncbi:TRADD-N-associated membrane domain-containing protein [Iningainema tapete]|uniref:Cyanobacterial TRADD-N associated 2 transmembrane domain-containing protein n=1 Tax=Iningainema tapete BLCC-T55 TaxID=2748662 RepID=A0A8J6XZB0_9CYAN|nr:hypothetical protein [Iningainema tapete]MBD2775963.1 hypothetical protein [Iningainema tapete BLCC-T55]